MVMRRINSWGNIDFQEENISPEKT